MQYGACTYDDAATDDRRSLRVAVYHGSIPNAGSGPDSDGIQIPCNQAAVNSIEHEKLPVYRRLD